MATRSKFFKFINVILRVPPLFFIDEIFRLGFGIRIGYGWNVPGTDRLFGLTYLDHLEVNGTEFDLWNSASYSIVVSSLLNLILSTCGCLIALGVFMLNIKQLLHVYMFILSVGAIFLSHCLNDGFLQYIADLNHNGTNIELLRIAVLYQRSGLGNIGNLVNQTLLYNFSFNIVIQMGLSLFFLKVHLGPYYKMLNTLIPISFTAPTLLVIFSLPLSIHSHLAVFSTVLPLALINYALVTSLFSIMYQLRRAYSRAKTYVTNFGMSTLLEYQWARLNVPEVLRAFWILRVIEHSITLSVMGLSESGIAEPSAALICKNLLVTGCETKIAVLGMTSIISYICHYIGAFFQWILQTKDQDDRSIGTVSAILFYILALQTGLTDLEPNDRFVRLCRNFCLLFTALLHFIHNIVNPLLMSLSASHNPALHRHVRALGVCSFLIIYPTLLLVYLWSHLELSTWLLAVSAFSTEVIIKVSVSLMIYCLFLIDAWRLTFWEKLDDYVYYIRAFGNTIEFCFGIFLFFNGAWILLFESGGGVRATMMCIHAYFNIWCEAKNGWVVFMKRKTAVEKIDSLPEASHAQLTEFDDVCAICYQDMIAAKITRCNHFFHGVCLRKWLYVQDRCPICHEILYKFKAKTKGSKSSPHDGNESNMILSLEREDGNETESGESDELLPSSSDVLSSPSTREQGSQTEEVSSEAPAQSTSDVPGGIGTAVLQSSKSIQACNSCSLPVSTRLRADSSLDQVRERLNADLDLHQRNSTDQATLVTADSLRRQS